MGRLIELLEWLLSWIKDWLSRQPRSLVVAPGSCRLSMDRQNVIIVPRATPEPVVPSKLAFRLFPFELDEGGSTIIRIIRIGGYQHEVSVDWAITDVPSVTPRGGTVVFAAGETTHDITVSSSDVFSDQEGMVTLSNPINRTDPAYPAYLGTWQSVPIVVHDIPSAVATHVYLAETEIIVNEGEVASFTILRDQGLTTETIEVDWEIDMPTPASTPEPASGTAQFVDRDLDVTVDVAMSPSIFNRQTGTLRILNVRNSAAGGIDPIITSPNSAVFTVMVTNIDVYLGATAYSGNEGEPLSFTIKRQGEASYATVSVQWTISGVTASPMSGEVVFPFNVLEVLVEVELDLIVGANRQGTITLANAVNQSTDIVPTITRANATLTVVNLEDPLTITPPTFLSIPDITFTYIGQRYSLFDRIVDVDGVVESTDVLYMTDRVTYHPETYELEALAEGTETGLQLVVYWQEEEADPVDDPPVDPTGAVSYLQNHDFPRIGNYSIGNDKDTSKGIHLASYRTNLAKCAIAIIGNYPGWSSSQFNSTRAVVQDIKQRAANVGNRIVMGNYTIFGEVAPNGDTAIHNKLASETGPTGNGGTWTPNDWYTRDLNGAHTRWYKDTWGVNVTDHVTPDSNGDYAVEAIADWYNDGLISTVPEYEFTYIDNWFSFPRTPADWDRDGVLTTSQAGYDGSRIPDNQACIDFRNGMIRGLNRITERQPTHFFMGNVGWHPAVGGALAESEYKYKINSLCETMMDPNNNGAIEYWDTWKACLDQYRLTLNNSKDRICMFGVKGGRGSQTEQTKWMRYGLATCLMDDGYYFFCNTYFEALWYDEWSVGLGKRVGNKPMESYPGGDGMWFAEFEGGAAICNPKGNGTASMTLPTRQGKHWVNMNGTTITSVTLPERDGAIVKKVNN